jgi:hypothetical protein
MEAFWLTFGHPKPYTALGFPFFLILFNFIIFINKLGAMVTLVFPALKMK